MKYSDIITLQDYFHPVFNLQNEATGYWKQFIPTPQFNTLLEKTLDAVASNIPAKRKSIWVQGHFGTGKSHAGAVIKHLLCDNFSEINDFINDRIENQDIKNKLNSFRKEKKYFPIVLSGVEGAYNPRTFTLSIERTVKESLKKAKYNIAVNSDFEQAVKELEENPLLKDFDEIIAKEPELRAIAKTKENIIKKLKNNDIEAITTLEEVLSNYSVQLSPGNITQWLSQVESEIKSQNIADGLLILWDEFTSVVNTINSGISNLIQKVAELSEKQNVYLFLISHRHVEQLSEFTKDDVSKMKDRFHIERYDMETITTYHIMAASIKKLDANKYDNMRKMQMEKNDNFEKLITYLTENTTQQSKQDILNLYPLHPYSAFLCSSIAGQIGSANRSVMKFLYDNENGFSAFLNHSSNENDMNLLTSDMLWDYFLDEFNDRGGEKYSMVVQTYFTHKNTVHLQGIEFEKVFKGILLLNAMKNTFEKEQVLPSQSNIIKLFEGIEFATSIEDILEYFSQNQIVSRDPSDNFLIAFSSLPIQEINTEIQRLQINYKDATQILDYDPEYRNTIKKIFENSLVREPELLYLSCSNDEAFIKSKIRQGFKQTYALPLVLLFANNNQELQTMKEIVQKFAKEEFQNKIFIVFDEYFDHDGLQKTQFIKYEATRIVATRRNSNDTAQSNAKNAKLIITNWINRLKQGNYKLYFNEEHFNGNVTQLASYLNNNIGYKIFSSGYEILPYFRINRESFYVTFKNKCSTPPEAMLMKNTRDEAESKFISNTNPAKSLFKNNDDYVVDSNLELKSDAQGNHPLVLAQKEVKKLLEKAKSTYSSSFNLGKVLHNLTRPPFGYYYNIPSVALLSYAMRQYVNELYISGLDTPITADLMKEKIGDIFTFWKDEKNENKLLVRFGSKEESVLKEQLIKIFDLEEITPKSGQDAIELSSITNVRWAIDSLFLTKRTKNPLWTLKYMDNISDSVKILIDKLNALIQNQNKTNQIEELKEILELLKGNLIDFQRILLQQTNFDVGFRNFVRQVESRFQESWWDELLSYLSQILPPEIGKSWKEDDVEKAVLRFYGNKIAPPAPLPTVSPSPTIHTQISEPVFVEKVSRIRNKINNASYSVPALKYILLQVLEKFPQVADIIDENLE
jgi:hypothetical protein